MAEDHGVRGSIPRCSIFSAGGKMRIDELTQEILDDIFKIYKKIVKSEEKVFPNLSDVKQYLISVGIFEYRVGSSLCGNSEFIVAFYEGVEFSFIPNCDSVKRREKRKEEKMVEFFGRAVQNYLTENHLL